MSAHWPKSLGVAVLEWRVREHKTQEKGAAHLGTYQTALSRWERGLYPPDFVALWRAGISIDALLMRAAEIEKAHLARVVETEKAHLDAEACYALGRALLDRPDLHATVTEILAREGAE